MSFERPLMLLALLGLAAAIGIWVLAERRRMRYAVRFTNLDVLASVAGGRAWRRFVPAALFLVALAALLAGLARPTVTRMVPDERATVILVVDTSRSMQARDVKPTRLGAAQEAVRTFLDNVPKQVRVGLIVFAGEAQVATPPTADHELVRESVDEIDEFLVFGGTAIGDALAAAVELAQQSVGEVGTGGTTIAYRPAVARARRWLAASSPDEPKSLASILFLSDGAQTRGLLLPLEGAELASQARIPVYTVALGTPNGTVVGRGFGGGFPGGGFGFPGGGNGQRRIPVAPDPDTLRAIAETTGGRFSEARSADALIKAYEKLGSSLGRKPGHSEITFLFVAAAAGLLVPAGVLSALWSPRLP